MRNYDRKSSKQTWTFPFRYLVLALLLIGFSLVQFPQVNAQSLGSIDPKSLKVDDLTDEQILEYIRQAEERNLTQSQLEALARQRGVSESEIAKLRRRILSLRDVKGKKEQKSTDNQRTRNSTDELDDPLMLDISTAPIPLTEDQKKIFGFETFNNKNLTFTPNLNIPTPSNYQLGPGDQVIVELWGASQQSLEFTVSPEGTIKPDNLGPIAVNGLFIEDARKRIVNRLSQVNKGLRPENGNQPTIFAHVSLGNVRTIQVEVVGNVKLPGTYSISSLSTVYTALHAAGGPTETGSFRDIRLIRNNKLNSTIDVYSYLTEGIKTGDKILQNGDVIVVKPFISRVEVSGAVKRAGFYEIKPEETFENLLNFSSGFSSTANGSLVTVRRNSDIDKKIIDLESDEFESFSLKDGDKIFIREILDRFSNRVIIEGAVHQSGEFELTDDMTLTELITKAGGLQGDAFLGRGTVFRMLENFEQSTIGFNLEDILNDKSDDIVLQKEDKVVISSIYDLKEEFYISIEGEVQEGGTIQYFDEMTVQDAIILSGGLKESASSSLIEISRRNKNGDARSSASIVNISIDKALTLSENDQDVKLQPFDQIYVRKSPGYSIQRQVTIEGEVFAPGKYTIQSKEERISDLIDRAKGLTPYAYAKGAILIRKTEFARKNTDSEISKEYVKQLRARLMLADSTLSNYSQSKLLERLEKVEDSFLENSLEEQKGSLVRKDLLQELSEQDSTVEKIEIREEEPVAIDLNLILENRGSKYDLILSPNDVISIPGKLETVRIAGEVISPLNVRYDERLSFRDYINDAGGFTATAQKGRSYVQYPNGRRKQTKRFLWFKFYPRVEPGSTIFISEKQERTGIGPQGWISIGTGLATLGLVTIQAINLLQN